MSEDNSDANDCDERALLDRRSYLGLAGAAAVAAAGTSVGSGRPARTRVDAVEAGADPTGERPVNETLRSVFGDDVEVYFPPGEYLIEPTALDGSNWALVGADATFVVPEGTTREHLTFAGDGWRVEGVTLDLRGADTAPTYALRGADWALRDVAVVGRPTGAGPDAAATFRATAAAGSRGVVDDLRATDGSGADGRPLFRVDAASAGTVAVDGLVAAGWTPGTVATASTAGELVVTDAAVAAGGVVADGAATVRESAFDLRGAAADHGVRAAGAGPVVVDGCSFRVAGGTAVRADEGSGPLTVARTRVDQAGGTALDLRPGEAARVLDVAVAGGARAPALSLAGRDVVADAVRVRQPGSGVRVREGADLRLADAAVDVEDDAVDARDARVATENLSRDADLGRSVVTDTVDVLGAVDGAIDVVADYGADNTGSSETTSEVQAAVDAAGPGDVVHFPNGEYRVDGVAVDTDAVTLRGESRDGVVLRPTGDGTLFSVGQNDDGYGKRDWAIERFTVDVTEPSGGQTYSYDNHEVSFDAHGTGEYRDVAVEGSMMVDGGYWDMFRCKNVPDGEVVTLTRVYVPHGVADTESNMSSSGKIVGAFGDWNVDGGVRLDGCHVERGGENTVYVEGANRAEIVDTYVARANVGVRIPGGPSDDPTLLDGLVMDQRYEVARQHWSGDSNARGLWNDTGSDGSFVLRNSEFDLRGPEGGVPVDVDGSNDWTVENCRFARGSWATVNLQSGTAAMRDCDLTGSTGVLATAAGGTVADCRAPSGADAFSGFDDVSNVSASDIEEPDTTPPVDLTAPYTAPTAATTTAETPSTTFSGTVVDDFGDGDLAEYTGATEAFSVVDGGLAGYDRGLVQSPTSGFGNLIYADADLPARPRQGETFAYLHRAPSYGGGVMFGVGDPTTTDPDRYGVYFDPERELQLYKSTDGAVEKLAATDLSTAGLARTTYEVEVAWNDPDVSGDAIVVRARAPDDGSVVAETVAAGETAYGDAGHTGVGWGDGPGQEYAGLTVTSTREPTAETTDGGVVDDFGDGDLAEYTGATEAFSVVDGGLAGYDRGLVQSPSSSFGDLIYAGDALSRTPTQGETFAYLHRAPSYGGGVMFGVGDPTAADPDRYGVYFDPERELQLYKSTDGAVEKLAATDLSTAGLARTTYEVEVAWNDPDVSGDAIVVQARDAGDGSVVAETVAAGETAYGDAGHTGVGWGDGPGQEYAGLAVRPDPSALPEHRLVVEGGTETATYEFTVSGELTADPERGALERTDAVSGSTASGAVESADDRDAYRFSGSVTEFAFVDGSATVLLNGTEYDATQVVGRPDLPHTLTVTGADEAAHYEFAVTDALEPAADTTEEWESITGSTADGWVEGSDIDRFRFSGELSAFDVLVGSATVTVDGDRVDPTAVDPVDAPALPHRLVVDVPEGGGESGYAFEVSEAVEKSPESGATRESTDVIDGTSVEGSVASGADAYRFAGDLLRFDLTGAARVDLDRDLG